MKSAIPFVDPTQQPPRRFSLLFVDDDPDILRSISAYIQRVLPQFDVLAAQDGPSALTLLHQRDVDIILTDFRMPHMDGIEFLAQARKLVPHARRMMLTAYADVSLATQAVNEQAVAKFLTKPIEPSALVAVLREIADAIVAEDAKKRAIESMLGRSP